MWDRGEGEVQRGRGSEGDGFRGGDVQGGRGDASARRTVTLCPPPPHLQNGGKEFIPTKALEMQKQQKYDVV